MSVAALGDDLCAVVLAAGQGVRLRPLTAVRTKALCPVGNVALLDQAMDRVAGLGLRGPHRVAVNAYHLADQVVDHVGGRAHLSVERVPLGTAGGVANLRRWINDRPVLVANADAYLSSPTAPGQDIAALFAGWDGSTVRILVVPADGHENEFDSTRFAGVSLFPADIAAGLAAVPSEIVHEVWRPAQRRGRLEPVRYDGTYMDTGTFEHYLAANLHAAGADGPAGDGNAVGCGAVVAGSVRESVIGAYARVDGAVTRSVLWPGAVVGKDEYLVDAVRVGTDMTVRASV